MPLEFNPSKTHWTKSAKDCYNIACNCYICEIREILTEPCQMKKTVEALLLKYGEPPIDAPEGYTEVEFYSMVKSALLQGETQQEIADRFNLTLLEIRAYIQRNNLYRKQLGLK